MHPVVVYTLSRLGLFAVAVGVLYLVGLRSFPLLLVAVLVSGLASYVLLSKQRDAVSERIATKRRGPGNS
ncbi:MULTISPECIES: DUF4229 domain-containing protein [Microbispora]|uniref:DUF4229 domain-containing protein n=3 Tax=Microbispora TaxID=2005 RepID=A0ABY3M5N1_9ACTN|nr:MULTISPECIES: DUF4229 domain-containing protein [Microbispora]GLW23658.1 hypothetical protein Mame01_37010 [Microbispora amethystogenes]MBO4269341.1 DUF4229 domain-containing protein [Microbispora triticiradicis]RGA05156.1 DUF4229 domain-containing protein [Microbispora triticiradicis]TLP66209.1 DUF4229 domain-containing protein [Microbispora fusca]TYB67993.1 DUF4229 domain-containing protein [Microbispora tritici]